MDVTMTLSGVDGADIDAFLDDVLDTCLRPAAHAGALVLQNEARALVNVHEGVLRDSIYRVHVENGSDRTRQVYEVSWNHSKAPHGHLVEYGHWRKNVVYRDPKTGAFIATKTPLARPVRVPAHSFIRRAYLNKADAAIAASQQRFAERYQEIQNRD